MSARLVPKLLLSAIAVGALVMGVIFLRGNDPSGSSIPYPPCVTHKFFGVHCPGCGTTRAVYSLSHLDIAGALRKNAVFVLATPYLLYVGVANWFRWLAPRSKWIPRPRAWTPPVIWSVLAALFLFAIVRNLPMEPFSLLAPR